MTSRFAPDFIMYSRSKLLGLMVGCGLAMGSAPAKSQSIAEPTPDKFNTTFSYNKTTPPVTPHAPEETGCYDEANDVNPLKAKNTRKKRSRWAAYIPMACHHSERELWGVPVRYNEKNNQGVIIDYEAIQGKSSSLYVTAGFYKNSLYQTSEIATVGFRQYLDKHNQFSLSVEAGAAMYRKLVKNFVDDGKEIMPTGGGPSKPRPIAMLYLQDNFIQTSKFDLGAKIGFTANPQDKTNLTTFGLVFTPHF